MKRRYGLLLLLYVTASAGAAEIPATVQVCGDESEWPPYTFYARQDGKKTSVVAGYNIDLLNLLLAKSGRQANYVLLPWKRCLAEATSGAYDIVLDGVKAPERLKTFLFPPSHYATSTAYLYNRDRPLPALTSPAVLSTVKACGQAGYIYNLPSNTPIPLVDTTAKSFDAVIKMLEQGRCDLVFADLEIVRGYRLIGLYDAFRSGKLAAIPAPVWGRSYTDFYLMVSPATPYHQELLQLLNTGLGHARASGDMQNLLARYLTPKATAK